MDNEEIYWIMKDQYSEMCSLYEKIRKNMQEEASNDFRTILDDYRSMMEEICPKNNTTPEIKKMDTGALKRFISIYENFIVRMNYFSQDMGRDVWNPVLETIIHFDERLRQIGIITRSASPGTVFSNESWMEKSDTPTKDPQQDGKVCSCIDKTAFIMGDEVLKTQRILVYRI